MTRSLVNPLAAVVAKASASLPDTTGKTAAAAERLARPEVHLVLADVSASMAEQATGRRKIDVLREAVRGLNARTEIVAFAGSVMPGCGAALPEPGGSTALHLALAYAADRAATRVLVISDGHPDDPATALRHADRLSARIDVIYCGPDWDGEGLRYMQRLARGGGSAVHRPPTAPARLVADVRRLAGPS